MNSQSNQPTRRSFLGSSIGTAAGAAMVCPAVADEPRRNQFAFQSKITMDLPQGGLRRVAVDDQGNVIIAAGNAIVKRDAEGGRLSESKLERPVRCLATRGSETVVGIRDHVRILRADGRLQHRLPTIGQGHLVGDVIVDGDSIVVTDVTAGSLKRFCSNGRWEVFASRKSGFSMPAGGRLIRSTQGNLAMTHPGRHRVELLSERGEVASSWGKRSRDVSGFQGCCNPLAAVSLRDGTMVTAEAGQVRLKQFGAGGQFVQQIAGPESFDVAAVASENDDPSVQQLPCAVGGVDLAVSADDTLWMLHVAAKKLIGWQAIDRA